MHEIVYRNIKEKSLFSWDKSNSFEQMWAHETNLYLSKNIDRLNLKFKNLNLLDLGTGTGTSALFAAKEGAEVVGVEVSETAIEMANIHKQKLGVSAEFIQGDVLSLNLKNQFNIVVDSTILHCIVGRKDRQSFYEVVRKHLLKDGYFFVNTMIAEGELTSFFPAEYFLFEDDVLWSLGINQISERRLINDKSYFPHRTILSKEKQIMEFEDNGFIVENLEVTKSEGVPCLTGFLKLRIR